MNHTRLTDDELAAYAQWAAAESDAPLARLVAELRDLRRTAKQWAIVVLPRAQASLLPYLLRGSDVPMLIVAPEGTTLPRLTINGQPCTFDTYDPAVPTQLRDRLREHGLCG